MTGTAKSTQSAYATGDMMIDALLYGTAWSGGTITYAFPELASDYSYTAESSNGFAPISQSQREEAMFALDTSYGNTANDGFSVEGFTNLNIVAGSSSSATIRFAQSLEANPTAYAYLPGTYRQAGDVWFGTNYNYTAPTAGNYAWHTLLHELGHALGLKHGHETGGNGALPSNYDSLEYSIMTYRTFVGDDTASYNYEQWGAPQTFMMSDIAALQEMYGADYETNSGRTVYSWSPDTGVTMVNGVAAISPGANRIFATIWDGGGKDVYDLRAYTTGVEIDLQPGHESTFNSGQLARLGSGQYAHGNIFNALLYHNDRHSLIENAFGGDGSDIITGNFGKNRLKGNAGEDILDGLAGKDFLVGGADADQFVFGDGYGKDRIKDFQHGVDRIDLSATDLTSFDDVLAISSQHRSNVFITVDAGDILILKNIHLSDLDQFDFLF